MGVVEARVKREVESAVGRAFASAKARGVSPARARKIRPCRVPGCGKPSKGPRFDFFCAQHRDLPAAEKAAIKAGKRFNGGKAEVKARKTPARPGKAAAEPGAS